MRVLLTSPSPSERSKWDARLSAIPGIRISKMAQDLSEAYHNAEHNSPSVAVFSEGLTRQPEFEVLNALLVALNIRVVVIQNSNFRTQRPTSAGDGRKVVIVDEKMADAEIGSVLKGRGPVPITARAHHDPKAAPKGAGGAQTSPGRVVMIGSSTGGIEALIKVLASFGPSSPPVFLVQHTGGAFSNGLARLLDGRSQITVCEAENGMTVGPGMAVLAPGASQHLEVRMRGHQATCRLVEAPEIGGHRPAVDALFHSGVPFARKIAAAILTGMGRDGAEGLLALKKAGARTFGQDKATSLVYGMPKVAAELNAVEAQLPIEKIGPALVAASSEKSAA